MLQINCIFDLLKFQAEKIPNAIALVSPDRIPMNYKRLFIHVKSVIKELSLIGVRRNKRIAIVLPNGPDMATTFLAVSAGATAVPLNPNYNIEDFIFYISNSKAEMLITQFGMDTSARVAAQSLGIPIIDILPSLKEEAGIFTFVNNSIISTALYDSYVFPESDDLAEVLHTSGTTTQPRIVPISQKSICTTAYSIKTVLELTNNDRSLNIRPLFHIHAQTGVLLCSLMAGGSIVCTPGFDSSKFFEWMKIFHPTWYSAVPTMHQEILRFANLNKDIIASCPLRFIRSASAHLPLRVSKELENVFKTPVIESYGLTETVIPISSNPLPPRKRKLGSVGIAMMGVEIKIVDEKNNKLLPNQIGEILVRRNDMMLGYEDNQTANENLFVDGWLKTGDQGFLDTEGYLFLTGRLKETINCGGEKISPQEVDAILIEHPDVAQAVTFGIPHPRLGEYVAAAIVLHKNASTTEKEILKFTARKLANLKMPRQIFIVDDIPKNSIGKVQRINLFSKIKISKNKTKPFTSIEKNLVDIWSQVLKIKVNEIGVNDNFFYLGGDSLLALELINQIEKHFGKNLPVMKIFQAPTIAQQSDILHERDHTIPWCTLEIIQSQGTYPPLFFLCPTKYVFSLTRILGTSQPVYNLNSLGLLEFHKEVPSLEIITEQYIQEIRIIQPNGPYYLVGYCGQTNLTLETAKQLQARGNKIAFLGLIHAIPYYPKWSLFDHWHKFRTTGFSYIEKKIKSKFLYIIKSFKNSSLIKSLSKKIHNNNAKQKLPQELEYERFINSFREALNNYLPTPHIGDITLFYQSEKCSKLAIEIKLAQSIAAGKIEICEIPAKYNDSLFVSPQVEILGKQLKQCLEKVQISCDQPHP